MMRGMGRAGALAEDKTVRPSSQSLRGAASMLAPHWPLLVLASISILLFAAVNLARPLVVQQAIDQGIIGGDRGALVTTAVVFFGLSIGVYVFQALSVYTTALAGQYFLRDLRVRVFAHMQKLSLRFFDGESSGRMISRMTNDMVVVGDLINNGFLMVVQSVLLLVGTVIILFILSPRLSLVTLSVVPPLLVATWLFRLFSARAYDRVRDRIAEVMVHMQETFSGMPVVQAFARERYNAERFGEINEGNYTANVDTVKISAVYIPFVELLGGLGVALILYYGGIGVIDDEVTLGTVAAFIFYLDFIFQPIQRLSQVYDTIQAATAALNKIFALLDEPPDQQESPDAKPLIQPVRGEVTFDDVTFAYGETPVLEDVDITITAGQRVAVVGATGAGKSTMAKLLMRFYEPGKGRVLIDGQDLRDLRARDLRAALIMVPQEGFLFTGTIRDNILFGRPDATEKELVAACRELGIDDFIQSLPEAYDTLVSFRGSRLSGGEKQLVSIARAFVADPAILVLDEATSSLDPETEGIVDAAIRRLLRGRTSIVIAHRLSTAEHADRILLLDHGRLVEDGSHDELVARDGHYAALHRQWRTGTQPASDPADGN
ncbi:MAG: ABC transporter ATP-binding protein [Chloroflexi bacterium]|nr:ABC transporter ATP-binding protein [Chloroflexota bacterium]MCI0814626.1 ABC transporter ATP-binding protein [Chloroflexota bacterium]MCI0817518.1 ABC transporter ATP-binding protein [Chloroflexota bacterium]MCI0882957.1 ABC transporter ATP-binding protein [Chloroflexota bacterium]MCI0885297.1 ABC transporter ATP-binding protein [Chloroflexota bacterium]